MGFPILEKLAGVGFQCWLGQYRYKNKHNLVIRKCLFFYTYFSIFNGLSFTILRLNLILKICFILRIR